MSARLKGGVSLLAGAVLIKFGFATPSVGTALISGILGTFLIWYSGYIVGVAKYERYRPKTLEERRPKFGKNRHS